MVFVFFWLLVNLEPPKDNGGAEVTKYVVELSEGLSGKFQMVIIKSENCSKNVLYFGNCQLKKL